MADNDTDQEVGIWIRVNTQGGKAFGDLARDLSRVSRAAVDTSRGFQSFIGVLKPFTFIWESVWRITYRALFILRALSNAVLMAAQAFVKFTKSITGIAWALGSGLVRAARASTERILGLAHAVGQKLVGGLARVYRWVTQLATVGFGALVAYTGRAVASFGQFEQALRNTSTVMGLVGRAVRQSEKALFDLGLYLSRKGIQSAQEVAQSFYDMGSAGLSFLQILQASPGILALAEATLSDLSQTAETTMGTMMGLRLSFSETNRVANAMAATIAQSPATMTKLTRALRYMGPVAGSFNIQLEEMLANMQALFFVGLPGEMVGTGLRMFILRLIAPTKESIKILQKYGLTVDDVNISVHGLTRVVERLAKAHLEASDLSMIFRARALTAASALLQQAGQLRRYQRELTNTNAAFQLQRLQLDTLAGTWKNLSNILAEVTLRFGRAASSGVRAALDIFRRVGLVAIQSHNVTNLGTAVGEIARQLGVLSGSAALKGLEGLSDFVTFVSIHGRAAIQLLAQMGRSFTGGLLSTAGSQM